MSTDYEPGTVAVATVRGVEGRRLVRFQSGAGRLGWMTAEHGIAVSEDEVTDVRPLVVLDPEDFATLDRLAALFHESWSGCEGSRGIGLGGALLKLAEPPRIPEPGLWGVVEAAANGSGERGQFVRTPKFWYCAQLDQARGWDALTDPTLIREGVES